MNSSKEIATKMEIEPIFCEKCIIRRKKQFDKNANDETTQSTEEYFRIIYIYIYIQRERERERESRSSYFFN